MAIVVAAAAAIFYVSQPSKQDAAMDKSETSSTQSNSGILAGTTTQYREFSQADYEEAIAQGKTVYLEFYANWCPICRAQQSDIFEGISQLEREDLVAFRVNYKDSDTDSDETALSKKYKVLYQHHKIVVRGQEVLIDTGETWSAQMVVDTLSSI